MRARGIWWVALTLVCGVSAGKPAGAQGRALNFAPPLTTRSVTGRYTVRWTDNAVPASVEGLRTITWFYANRADGSDRKRMVTRAYEDFSNFLVNWRPQGPIQLGWISRQDRGLNRKVLTCKDDIGPAYSVTNSDRDAVISLLVRPYGTRNEFSLGARIQQSGRGYEVRNTGSSIQILEAGRLLKEQPAVNLMPMKWYWYELSICTRKKTDVEVRLRVFDEKRERTLVSMCNLRVHPTDRDLTGPGVIALTGPADFAELYVDPWNARWAEDDSNEFDWNTENVPDGKYYLIAEVSDGTNPKYSVVSNYQVEVRNPGRTASN